MEATPGPWSYGSGAVYHAEKGRLILADRENPNTSPAERDTNLRLCAAAPDLLAALESLLADAGQGKMETIHRTQLALLKAKGGA